MPRGAGLAAFRLSADEVRRAGLIGLTALGAALLGALALIGLAVMGFPGPNGSPLDWVQGAVMLVGLSMGGSVHLGFSAGDQNYGGHGDASVSAAPLLLTAVVLLTVAVLSRRNGRRTTPRSGPELVTRAVATAGGFAVPLGLLAALLRGRIPFGLGELLAADELGGDSFSDRDSGSFLTGQPGDFGDVSLHVGLVRVVLLSVVLVAGVAFVARFLLDRRIMRSYRDGHQPRSWGPLWLDGWFATARPFAESVMFMMLAAFLVAAVVAGIGATHGDITTISPDGDVLQGARFVGTFAVEVLTLLPSGLFILAGLLMGATVQGTSLEVDLSAGGTPDPSRDGDRFGIFEGGLDWWASSGLVIALAVMLFVAVRLAMGTPRAERASRSWWRLSIVFAAGWGLLGLLTSLHLGVDTTASGDDAGRFTGSYTAGVSVLSLIVVGAIWGAAIGVLAGRPAQFLLALTPRMAWIGSKPFGRIEPEWAGRLAIATQTYGKRIPAGMSRDTAGLVQVADILDVRPRRTRIVLTALTASFALVVALIAGGFVLNDTVYGPRRVARAYLEALARGDAPATLGLITLDSAHGDVELLDADHLRRQRAAGPITSITVGSAQTSDDAAVVPVSYRVGGEVAHAQVRLSTSGKHHWGVFSDWKVDNGTATISIDGSQSLLGLAVNGANVPGTNPAGEDSGPPSSFEVFPGAVPIASTTPSVYFAPVKVTATVEPGDDLDATSQVQSTPTVAATEAVRVKERNLAQECANQDGPNYYDVSDPCPDGIDAGAAEYNSTATWELVGTPRVEVRSLPSGPGDFAVSGSAIYRVSYIDYFDGAQSYLVAGAIADTATVGPSGVVTVYSQDSSGSGSSD